MPTLTNLSNSFTLPSIFKLPDRTLALSELTGKAPNIRQLSGLSGPVLRDVIQRRKAEEARLEAQEVTELTEDDMMAEKTND